MNNQEHERITRRKFVLGMGAIALVAAGGIGAYEVLTRRQQKPEQALQWATNPEGILTKIEELHFLPGSELRTTLFFRKMMWENAQLQKLEDSWIGGDESDWMNHQDVIDKSVTSLAEAGFKGGRLVVVPFEITEDGENYNWALLDTAVGIMNNHNMAVDLCVGPLDYPYGPAGIRLPRKYQNLVAEEVVDQGNDNITISLGQDYRAPELSAAIRDYSLDFLKRILERYGNDTRVDKLYISNEWPDTHLIEGVQATMNVDAGFMQEVVKMTRAMTDKKIALNTNIHPSNVSRLQTVFGPLLNTLGDQGILGIDAYPTQEAKIPRLASEVKRYGVDIQAVQRTFPKADIVFTELQAEPWPPAGIAGKSWAAINAKYASQVMVPFFQQEFPKTLQSYVINSGIKEVGLWGSEVWPLVAQMKYPFPLHMMTTVAETMKKRS